MKLRPLTVLSIWNGMLNRCSLQVEVVEHGVVNLVLDPLKLLSLAPWQSLLQRFSFSQTSKPR